MKLPESVTTAFRRLLAPQPMVLLFHDVKGLAWHAAEVSETYQVIVGLSLELAYEVNAIMFEQTGRRLTDVAKILEVHGTRCVIPVVGGYEGAVVPGDHESIFAATTKNREIVIIPKPLEFVEAKPIDPQPQADVKCYGCGRKLYPGLLITSYVDVEGVYKPVCAKLSCKRKATEKL